MAPVPHAEWQTDLRDAIERRYGSLKGYARHLAGPDASEKQVDAKRRPMMKWLQPSDPTVPSPESVARLLADGVAVDPAAFPKQSERRRYTTEELASRMDQALANQRSLWTELRRVADAADAVRSVAESNSLEIGALRQQVAELHTLLRGQSSGQPLAGSGGTPR